jgi:hypothetical protein
MLKLSLPERASGAKMLRTSISGIRHVGHSGTLQARDLPSRSSARLIRNILHPTRIKVITHQAGLDLLLDLINSCRSWFLAAPLHIAEVMSQNLVYRPISFDWCQMSIAVDTCTPVRLAQEAVHLLLDSELANSVLDAIPQSPNSAQQ